LIARQEIPIVAPKSGLSVCSVQRLQPIFASLVLLTFILSPTAADAASNAVEFVGQNSIWRFRDDGAEPDPLWRAPNFNDSGWSQGQGQFGYNENDERTIIHQGVPPFITHYFRCTFAVARPADYATLLFRVLRDDGAVVYLNGNEVFRMNMPEGPITCQTPALSQVTGTDESTYFPTNINAAWLVDGANTLAVELHQTSMTVDASFDLSLFGIEVPQKPTLSFDRQGSQTTLRWDDPDFGLEQTQLPAGDWSWVTNAISPYEIPAGGSRLFRLRSR
jgi:hypothetical protein